MTKYNYYLAKIERSDPAETDIHTAYISCHEHDNCEEHDDCIVIYGEDEILTECVIKTLEGLNG